MPKFTIEEHEKRMRGLLSPKTPEIGVRTPNVLQALLDKVKQKVKKPSEGESEV